MARSFMWPRRMASTTVAIMAPALFRQRPCRLDNRIYPPVIAVDAIDPSRAFVATTAGLFSLGSNGQSAGENDYGMAVEVTAQSTRLPCR